jgi:hypothetical protein
VKVWPKWTQPEIDRVRELAQLGFQSPQIAERVGRTRFAVSHICTQHRIKLSKRKCFGTAPADRDAWDDIDRLSMWANVPHELAEFVVQTAKHFNIGVKTLRSSSKTDELVKCRQRIAVIARKSGYSYPVIGRALNRDHTTICYAVNSAKSSLSTGLVANSQSGAGCAESKIAA